MSPLEPIPPQPGNAGDTRHFVGRRRATQEAERKLGNGSNLLLNDPRRLGKSYWLKYFTQTTTGYVSFLIDVEGVTTREAFLIRVVEGLRQSPSLGERSRDVLRSLFENVDIAISAGPVTIKPAFKGMPAIQLLQQALGSLAEDDGRPILVCMDEVPLAVLNIARNESPGAARELLQLLRRLRQDAALRERVRWILAGSIGFHHVIAECGTTEGDLNDLDSLPLGPLAEDEAFELVQRLLLGIGREAAAQDVEWLVARTGAIPFLIHKVASLLEDGSGAPVSEADFSEAFEEFVDDPDEFRSFGHLLTRLDTSYGERAETACRILDTLVSEDDAAWHGTEAMAHLTSPDELGPLLKKLTDDHYLRQRGTRYQWRYPVLRYIWARRRGITERP